MTTIDHAAEARKLIEDAYADDPALLNGIKAVAHAQLAFVEAQREANEQARIANVIALGQARAGDGSLPFRHLVMVPVNEFDVGPTDDIKKGLGL